MFDEKEQMSVFQLVASCLHLGNVEFEGMTVRNMDASEVSNTRVLRDACKLLMVDQEELANALTSRSTFTRGEVMVTPLSADDAADVRDAFVKAIYGRVFIWIVEKINKAIYKPPEPGRHVRFSIGVLDIFGFENFEVNR
jgi:myosin-7